MAHDLEVEEVLEREEEISVEASELVMVQDGEQDESFWIRPRSRRDALGLGVGGAAALLLAACGGDNDGDGERQPEDLDVCNDPVDLEGVFVPEMRTDMELIWQWDRSQLLEDQFHIATPDEKVYNDEEQVYTPNSENVRTEQNVLILGACRSENGEITSGKVTTQGIFSVGIGDRIEATMRVPKGQGVWPAFWLLSDNNPHTANLTDTQWQEERAYMKDGEIDIMEYYGHTQGMVEGTLHTYAASTEGQQTVADADEAFHTYAVELHLDRIDWFVDDTLYFTAPKPANANTDAWPITAENRYYLILNVAMGGSGGGEIIDAPDDDWRMPVSSIRVYNLAA